MAFLANALVFILMGLRIEFGRILHEPVLLLLTLALVTLARILLAFVALPAARNRIAPAWRAVIALSGMRGALSVALAIGLPADIPFRPQLVDTVFGVVFITLVAQGLAIGPLITRLRLAQ
jgi:CPA1 family monovalent cation:H+ antiporter